MGINRLGTHRVLDGEGVVKQDSSDGTFFVDLEVSEYYEDTIAVIDTDAAYYNNLVAGDKIKFGFVPSGYGKADVVVIDEVIRKQT